MIMTPQAAMPIIPPTAAKTLEIKTAMTSMKTKAAKKMAYCLLVIRPFVELIDPMLDMYYLIKI